MAKLTRFPGAKEPRTEAEQQLAAALAQLQRLADSGDATVSRQAAKILAASQPKKGGFMRIWIDRNNEINEELDARADTCHAAGKPPAVSVNLCIRVLGEAVGSLPLDGQRMGKTQAMIAAKLRITAPMASEAFKELHAVGAVFGRQREGKSITWEVDAEYASRLDDPQREKAIKAQQKIRAEEGRDAKKQALLDKIGHNVLPWPDRATAEQADPRQLSLIDIDED
jgi:hypothetical protein